MTEAMKNRSRKRWKLCAGILLLCAVLGVSIYYGVTVSNAATITVGLYLLPMLFCTIKTGRIPPCSDPTTGLKSA